MSWKWPLVVSGGVKPRVFGGELRLRGWIDPAWTAFDGPIYDGVMGHDESTDHANGDRDYTVLAENALFCRWLIRSRALWSGPQPTPRASTRRLPRSCYVGHIRGSQRKYAQSRSCVAGDTGVIVRRVSGAHADCFGNGDQNRVAIGIAPTAHIQRSNNAVPGRT
jgi:hypothetical protein